MEPSYLHFLISIHPVHVAPARDAVHHHVHRVAHLCKVLTRGHHTHVTLYTSQQDVADPGVFGLHPGHQLRNRHREASFGHRSDAEALWQAETQIRIDGQLSKTLNLYLELRHGASETLGILLRNKHGDLENIARLDWTMRDKHDTWSYLLEGTHRASSCWR